MKIFKKLLAVLVAVVMAFAVFAFAGCTDPDDSGNNTNNSQSGSGNGCQGGSEGGNQGGSEGGNQGSGEGGNQGSGEGGNQGGSEGGSNTPAVDVLGNVIKGAFSQELTTLTLTNTGDDGADLGKLSIDLVNGNADFEKVDLHFYDDEETGESIFISYSYKYYFLRDWNLFSYYEPTQVKYGDESYMSITVGKKITDFTNKELTYEGNILEDQLGDMYNEQVPAYIAMAGKVLPRTNYSILALANAADAVTVENGKVTVDFIKLVYNTVENLKTLVNGLDEQSTLGSILQDENVKAYLMSFTELVTPEEIEQVIGLLLGMFGGAGGTVDAEDGGIDISAILSAILPPADDFDTTYDYIYEILSSETLCALLKWGIEMLEDPDMLDMIYAMIGQMEIPVPEGMLEGLISLVKDVLGENTSLTEINISETLELFDMDLDSFKSVAGGMLDMLGLFVSEDSLIIPALSDKKDVSPDYDDDFDYGDIFAVADDESEEQAGYSEYTVLNLVYNIDANYQILSQEINAEIYVYETADSEGVFEEHVLTITYAPADFAVENVSGNTVVKSESNMLGASESADIEYIADLGETTETLAEFTLTFTVESVEEMDYGYYTDYAVSFTIEVDGEEVELYDEALIEYLDGIFVDGLFVYEPEDGEEGYLFGYIYFCYTDEDGREAIDIDVYAIVPYEDGEEVVWKEEFVSQLTVCADATVYENTVAGILEGEDWQLATQA